MSTTRADNEVGSSCENTPTVTTTNTTASTPTTSNNNNQRPKLFQEIKRDEEDNNPFANLPDEVETYVATIEPKLCRTLLKELGSFLPLIKVEDKIKFMKMKTAMEKSKIDDNGGTSVNTSYDTEKESTDMGSNNCNDEENDDHDDDIWMNYNIPLGHLRRVRRSQLPMPVSLPVPVKVKDPESTSITTTTSTSASASASASASTSTSTSTSTSVSITSEEPPTKRTKNENSNNKNNNTKKKKAKKNKANTNTNAIIKLEVLIGSVKLIDYLLDDSINNNNNNQYSTKSSKLKQLIQKYNLQLYKLFLQGRPAKSQQELDEWKNNLCNNRWPTLYYNELTTDYKEKELELDLEEEYGMMYKGMMSAIQDAKSYRNWYDNNISNTNSNDKSNNENDNHTGMSNRIDIGMGDDGSYSGAIIMCPETEQIISTSFQEMNSLLEQNDDNENTTFVTTMKNVENENKMEKERIRQSHLQSRLQLLQENPLNTPVLFAIQGVSRRERLAATGLGMDNDSFKNNQYLCTGYDVYLTKEPNVFEAMALVHSRIRRVVFCHSSEDGGLGGGGPETSIHSLPATNHRYRAFKLIEDRSSDIYLKFIKIINRQKA